MREDKTREKGDQIRGTFTYLAELGIERRRQHCVSGNLKEVLINNYILYVYIMRHHCRSDKETERQVRTRRHLSRKLLSDSGSWNISVGASLSWKYSTPCVIHVTGRLDRHKYTHREKENGLSEEMGIKSGGWDQ